jgi:hypothetical protein
LIGKRVVRNATRLFLLAAVTIAFVCPSALAGAVRGGETRFGGAGSIGGGYSISGGSADSSFGGGYSIPGSNAAIVSSDSARQAYQTVDKREWNGRLLGYRRKRL